MGRGCLSSCSELAAVWGESAAASSQALLLSAPLPGRPGTVVKALFDGHGGHVVSRKCAIMAPTFLGEKHSQMKQQLY